MSVWKNKITLNLVGDFKGYIGRNNS